MRVVGDTPLPGDLVIGELQDTSGARLITISIVTRWPHLAESAGPYLSYGYALQEARRLAAPRGAQVWRQRGPGGMRADFDNVTED